MPRVVRGERLPDLWRTEGRAHVLETRDGVLRIRPRTGGTYTFEWEREVEQREKKIAQLHVLEPGLGYVVHLGQKYRMTHDELREHAAKFTNDLVLHRQGLKLREAYAKAFQSYVPHAALKKGLLVGPSNPRPRASAWLAEGPGHKKRVGQQEWLRVQMTGRGKEDLQFTRDLRHEVHVLTKDGAWGVLPGSYMHYPLTPLELGAHAEALRQHLKTHPQGKQLLGVYKRLYQRALEKINR